MLFVLCTETTHTHIQALFQLILQKTTASREIFYTLRKPGDILYRKNFGHFLPTHSRGVKTQIYHVWFLSGLLVDELNQGKMSRAQVDLPEHGATFSKNGSDRMDM